MEAFSPPVVVVLQNGVAQSNRKEHEPICEVTEQLLSQWVYPMTIASYIDSEVKSCLVDMSSMLEMHTKAQTLLCS